MAATSQLRGMLLEEIVLKFLEGNGYRSILEAGSDPTLENGPNTRFTAPAQDYAFVQDIFLLPLAEAATLRPVLAALRQIECPAPLSGMQLKAVRTLFRASLRSGEMGGEIAFLRPVVESARAIGVALIGMALNGMPLFLVPDAGSISARCHRRFRRG